jgi:putative phosphoesterase
VPPIEHLKHRPNVKILKICIISDSHDRSEPLAAAISAAHMAGAEAVIHCGDLIGANTLRASLQLGLPIHVVQGNNVGDTMAVHKLMAKSVGKLIYHGVDATLEMAGRRIFVTHYPHYARGMACTGDYDLVCCGHSHVAEVLSQANIKGVFTTIANPGTIAGVHAPGITTPCTWIMADLEKMTFEIQTLAQ